MYAIIDIETTGGSAVNEKITEIAIFVHDGEKVVDEFVTLINPEKSIPYYITGLTGITNEMVADAPKFYEVAKKIVEITEGRTFVAHNATFDYNFIKSEFRSLGFNFQRDVLCTVKLSRKLIPGKRSYSLGNLCDDLGIHISDRHRAAGDALATVKLFELLLDIKAQTGVAGFEMRDYGLLHPALNKEKLDKLPEETGVYYLYNDQQEIIYIGKSKDIKARVVTHLGVSKNKTALKMRKEIADISYELTGSELVALLLESEEIKNNQPLYNRTQRRSLKHFGIYSYENAEGYMCFAIEESNKKGDEPLRSFDSWESASDFLYKLVDQYTLCQKLSGLYKSSGACFHFELRQCNGACTGVEDVEAYNQRAHMAIQSIQRGDESLIVIDKGRHKDERSVIKVQNGKYIGYGYIDLQAIYGIDALNDCIQRRKDNREVYQIIQTYLRTHKVERVIRL